MVEFDIRGLRVDEVGVVHAVTLVLTGGATIRIESVFRIEGPAGGARTIDPENAGNYPGLEQVLAGRLVEGAVADEESGLLSIAFLGGLVIRVPPDPGFEAWSISWADGSTAIALPGGGMSTWGARL